MLPAAKARAEGAYASEADRWKYVHSYLRGFASGLEDVPGTTSVGKAGSSLQAGFEAGLEDCRALSAGTNQPLGLVDFGYEPAEAAGIYEAGFENSRFRPTGTEEKWWVKFRKGAIERYSEKRSIERHGMFLNARRCAFKGYLDPRSAHGTGHMNQFDRDFVVVEILEVGPEQAGEDAQVEISP